MAYYYSIPIEEMEEELESLRFYPVNLVFRNKPVKEWVYERKLPRSPNHFVRIYTGIQRYGQSAGESRKAGKDAIRIQVIYRDAKGETLVSQTKRVHRVGGWRKNLHKRMDEVATELPQVEFDSRGEPMTLRKKGKNQFWGSRDYPKFKETKPFRAEEIRCCKECDKTTGLTTIQTGTYCYDCLPINLGAEPFQKFEGEMEEYAPNETDDGFTSMSNLAYITLPDYDESYYWISEDENSRATVAFDPENEVILIPNFEVSLRVRGQNMASEYLGEMIDDLHSDFGYYPVQVSDVDNHAIGFWEKMQSQGLIDGWSKGSFAAEDRLDYRDYLNDLRSYPELKNLSDEQLLARGIDCLALQTANQETFAAEDNYDATYGKAQAKIRRKLKNKIKKQATMGTKAGQWSARKSQELKRQYEAACDKKGLNPYKGKKTKSQDNLSKWSKQKWGTASGKKSSTTGEPYFPAKAITALKKKDLYSKAKRQKAKATRAGKQNARYSDDIRKVVAQYRAEGEDELIADFKNMSKKERDAYAPDNWKIEMYWAADGSTYILRRIFKPESYGAVVDLIDEINVIAAELDHHALITFDKERVMVQLWTHDVHNITELDIAFAELLNQFADKWELNAESPEWDDIDWKTDKPPAKEHEDWGDDVEWDAEDEEITMREFDDTTAEDFIDDSDDRIVLMLRKKSKINRYGDIGCPVCGSIGLFSEEIIAKGKKWYCYGCLYEDKEETIKGKGDITLEKYGLEITCPICKKAVKAFNNDSMLRHIKKCGVPK